MLIDRENYVLVASELTFIYVDAAFRLVLKFGIVAALKIKANWGLVFLTTYHLF
jgi:hypothetical protein